MGKPLWKISTLSPLTNRLFYRLELPFTKYNIIKHFLWTCFPKKEIISKVLFFNKNHCLWINFLTFYKCTFFSSKMVCLLLSTSLNTFSTPNLLTIIKKLIFFQQTMESLQNFDQNQSKVGFGKYVNTRRCENRRITLRTFSTKRKTTLKLVSLLI